MTFIILLSDFILPGIDLHKNGCGHQRIQLIFLSLGLDFSSGSDYKTKDLLPRKSQWQKWQLKALLMVQNAFNLPLFLGLDYNP